MEKCREEIKNDMQSTLPVNNSKDHAVTLTYRSTRSVKSIRLIIVKDAQ